MSSPLPALRSLGEGGPTAALDQADDQAFLTGGEPTENPGRADLGSASMPRPGSAGATTDPGDTDASDAPVIALVDSVLAAAVRRRASDVHFEPMAGRLRVRFRIDGALVDAGDPPHRLQAAVLARLKLMAGLSLAERRAAQDGRCRIELAGGPVDLRVSSLPTVHGESLAIRLLDRGTVPGGLEELGLGPGDAARLARMLARPDGLILVTGPTGSGKTTTLYACLAGFSRPGTKIITVEDPVEYPLPGVNQVQVKPAIGLTFAAALRAILRQAPNVIMIGEIRDLETAAIALHAAQTGHLVLATLHTNDTPGAITRLLEMGLPPFLVAASLRGVLAQRLVRRVCPACARPAAPAAREAAALGLDAADRTRCRAGAGCPECSGTGFRGRLGLFELLEVDAALQEIIHRRAGRAELAAATAARGGGTLRTDGARKVTAGLTTAAEVVSILGSEPPEPTPSNPERT
jgi:type IV pilus assembly protein PilB